MIVCMRGALIASFTVLPEPVFSEYSLEPSETAVEFPEEDIQGFLYRNFIHRRCRVNYQSLTSFKKFLSLLITRGITLCSNCRSVFLKKSTLQ